jgi:hypothetical protein
VGSLVEASGAMQCDSRSTAVIQTAYRPTCLPIFSWLSLGLFGLNGLILTGQKPRQRPKAPGSAPTHTSQELPHWDVVQLLVSNHKRCSKSEQHKSFLVHPLTGGLPRLFKLRRPLTSL